MRSGDGVKYELAAFRRRGRYEIERNDEAIKMNFKGLPRQVRSLVEALNEAATDEKFEIVDVEEDGDTVTVTFSRDVGFSDEAGESGDDDDL